MARFLVGAAACAAVAATLPLKTLTDPNSAPAFVDRPARARRLAPQQQLQPRPSGLGEFSDTSTLAMRFADKSAQTFRFVAAVGACATQLNWPPSSASQGRTRSYPSAAPCGGRQPW